MYYIDFKMPPFTVGFINLTVLSIVFAVYIHYSQGIERGTYIGCYKYVGQQEGISNIPNVQDCVESCEKKSLKYALLSNNSCFCSNFLGDLGSSNSAERCSDYSVYSSTDSIPGPPKNFMVNLITEEGVEISWEKPEGFVEITKYEICANVLHTFSPYPIPNATWVYSNTTSHTTLSLQSASRFNLTIQARSMEGLGSPASKIVETLVGVPDNKPYPPKILTRAGSQMTIKIDPVINTNGPISYYRIIVLEEAAKGIFQLDYLKNYEEALKNDLNYYIAAELLPEDINKKFTIGDDKYYGIYHNAPLLSYIKYSVIVGIVSSYNNVTKVAYGSPSKIKHSSYSHDIPNDSSTVSVFLIIAIVILSVMLIVGILGFFFIRKRVKSTYRHNRLSEQELTLQGPMITIENSAYLPEDEQMPVNHYKNLKKNVRLFNIKDELNVDSHSIIGRGRFGTICNATVNENNRTTHLAAYTIPDKSLATEEKKKMLKSLDMLIRCAKHINLIELVGTSESSHMLYVLLKVFPTNLKQFLINNRTMLPNKFSKVSESQILDIIKQISQGLLELEKCKVIHTKLCARNIMLTEDLVPKIFGFGLADYVIEQELDCTRWTAVEVLKGQDFNSRSPIWSFGILLWEICSLGATPFSDISNIAEFTDKVSRGMRLPQLKYFSDEVYQIMLSCWQVDMDERPNCESLGKYIEDLSENLIIPYISFQLYQTFEYEQYKPELEFKPFNV